MPKMNKNLINEASQKLSPKKVLICSSNFWIDTDYAESEQNQTSEIQSYNTTTELRIEKIEQDEKPSENFYTYIYFYDIGIRSVDKTNSNDEPKSSNETESKILFEIKARFKVIFTSSIELEEKCSQEFGKYNVGHNVWPYWREYVQNACQRMGISIIEVPFYRV